ncbi:MAG: sulfatase-like hydrolase/transferase [Spirochaetota bacterium]
MPSTRSRKPNVIVFFTDQQRADTTGLHGNPMGLTPNFDRMAQAGTHFVNTFTCQPVCGPARATLQTGRFASTTGVWRNGIRLPADQPRVSTLFSEAGYATGYIGKWHLSEDDPVPREEQIGYDYWMGSNVLEFQSDAYDLNLFDADGTKHHFPGYRVDAQTDLAIRYIDEHADDPFFLYLSYLEPHHQNHVDSYPAPTGYERAYGDPWTPGDLRALGGSSARHLPGYYGMVRRLDEALGRVEDALRSLDLLDDTIILYISDHGNHFKTRNGEYKRSCHDASLHVPCFASGPGFRGGGRVEELVSLVDIAPTLLDAAGLEPLPGAHGRSAVPLVGGDGRKADVSDWPDHVFVQISEAETGRAIRTHRWTYGVSHVDPAQERLRPSAEYADEYTELFLYDLAHDPNQLENLINRDSHSAVRERMRGLLLERIRSVEGRTPRIVEPEIVSGGQRKVSRGEVLA